MDGLPAIHLCLLLKAMNRTQRLGLRIRVEEEAENLGINVQSHGEKAYAEWVDLLRSHQIGITAAFVVSMAFISLHSRVCER